MLRGRILDALPVANTGRVTSSPIARSADCKSTEVRLCYTTDRVDQLMPSANASMFSRRDNRSPTHRLAEECPGCVTENEADANPKAEARGPNRACEHSSVFV